MVPDFPIIFPTDFFLLTLSDLKLWVDLLWNIPLRTIHIHSSVTAACYVKTNHVFCEILWIIYINSLPKYVINFLHVMELSWQPNDNCFLRKMWWVWQVLERTSSHSVNYSAAIKSLISLELLHADCFGTLNISVVRFSWIKTNTPRKEIPESVSVISNSCSDFLRDGHIWLTVIEFMHSRKKAVDSYCHKTWQKWRQIANPVSNIINIQEDGE